MPDTQSDCAIGFWWVSFAVGGCRVEYRACILRLLEIFGPVSEVYDFSDDMYSQDSVDLLRHAGIDFVRHQNEGIRMEDFGELLTTSGLVVDDSITWLTFHR